jgi:hypothetical protein
LTSTEGVLETPGTAGPVWYRHYLLSIEPDGSGRDTIGEFGLSQRYWDGTRQDSYMYGARTFVLPSGNDLVLGNASSYTYRVMARDGTIRCIVRRAAAPQPVRDVDVEAVVTAFLESAARGPDATDARLAEVRGAVEGYPRAATRPAYSSMLIDADSNVWVERYRWYDEWSLPPDPRPTTWDVFTPAGAWVAEVVIPAGVLLLSVSHDRVFGVRVDDMDVRHVVVHRLVRP